MKLFNIIQKTTGNILDHGDFPDEAQGYAWFAPFMEKKRYGRNEETIQVLVSEEVPEMREIQSVLVTPEVRDPETDEVIDEAVYEDQEVITQNYAPAVYRDEVIPAEYTIEITDVTAETEAERVKGLRIQAGANARQTCTNVLDLISGENLEKELTLEQISDLQLLFGNIEKALQSSRPTLAKMLISAVEPDEVLITQELKDSCLELLADY